MRKSVRAKNHNTVSLWDNASHTFSFDEKRFKNAYFSIVSCMLRAANSSFTYATRDASTNR